MIFLEQPVVDGHALATDHFSAEIEKKTRHGHIFPHIDAVHLNKKYSLVAELCNIQNVLLLLLLFTSWRNI